MIPSDGSAWENTTASPKRLLGHEMVISENAYTNDALLDLVILSLQLQSEVTKAAGAKGAAGT